MVLDMDNEIVVLVLFYTHTLHVLGSQMGVACEQDIYTPRKYNTFEKGKYTEEYI
jgi:hypothetical protein